MENLTAIYLYWFIIAHFGATNNNNNNITLKINRALRAQQCILFQISFEKGAVGIL